jgi:hypothetical protein
VGNAGGNENGRPCFSDLLAIFESKAERTRDHMPRLIVRVMYVKGGNLVCDTVGLPIADH